MPTVIASRASSVNRSSSVASPRVPLVVPSSSNNIFKPTGPSSRVTIAARPPFAVWARTPSSRSAVSGSTNTSIVPPHVSPISHASSSPRFSSRSRGRFVFKTSSVCSMTWASTQPPMVTEPSTDPPSPTSILAPSLRGVVPRVFTRVATATLPGDRRSSSI